MDDGGIDLGDGLAEAADILHLGGHQHDGAPGQRDQGAGAAAALEHGISDFHHAARHGNQHDVDAGLGGLHGQWAILGDQQIDVGVRLGPMDGIHQVQQAAFRAADFTSGT